MSEIVARIGAEGMIELADSKGKKIGKAGSLTPQDAAYLARGLLAAAAAMTNLDPPHAGQIIEDAHLHIYKVQLGASAVTGNPALRFSIAPGIELTFEVAPKDAAALGKALVGLTATEPSPAHPAGKPH
jgi:hypothetical protein